MQDVFSQMPSWVTPAIIILAVWSSVWKALALYKAGRIRQPVWFVVMFLVNTVGILEIFYIFVFSKMVPVSKNETKIKPATVEAQE